MNINRRNFLKKAAFGIAMSPFTKYLSRNSNYGIAALGRVTAESISVHSQPSESSTILFQQYLDDIVHIYDSVISEDGPGYNPIWHRVWGGFVHSAFVQNVRNQLNPIQTDFPSSGQLMQVSVPFSQSYRIRQNGNWEQFYRLYYSSIHWVFETLLGPDGEPWYKVNDSLLTLSYYVRAIHMRKVTDIELSPIHPQIDPKSKRIEISIDFQSLRAIENDQVIKDFYVSTGLPSRLNAPGIIPTDTPKGNHRIQNKRPSVHMGDGTLRSDAEAYELPGVPWVSYFEPTTGVAIHGTYWHNNFGVTMSHGCVNMRSEEAKWIYRWCHSSSLDGESSGFQTPVSVI